ncbi:MAG: hypothetical protein FWF37_01155 [Chloroflexi bacterium]|nr:hypothetical protein [Chloroflexota bacterium]
MNQEDFDEYEIERHATSKETNASCPQCAASIRFNPSSGLLCCDYCGWEGGIILSADDKVLEQDYFDAEHTQSFQWGVDKISLVCQSCGAQSIYDVLYRHPARACFAIHLRLYWKIPPVL